MSTAFPVSFSPIKIGPLTLPNRFLMGAMHTGLEDLPDNGARLARFYQRRVQGGVSLIVTGGVSPNESGVLYNKAAPLISESQLAKHETVTRAVHESGGYICMQILHAGRYALHDKSVAPSAIKSPITPFPPRELTPEEIEQQISDFTRCALLAKQAGYDGVEIMGSEGYLINEFLVRRTNKRSDIWGGEGAMRFPARIIEVIRKAAGPEFLIIYRLSMLDLVEEGGDWEQIENLARAVEKAGADVINTGIGWHESRIPTIATMVPRAAFAGVTAKLKKSVAIPVVAANRINTPESAEEILAAGQADMVSLARPFLADPDFVNKARDKRAVSINSCIACNQACLDHVFQKKIASCLVNPAACHEDEFAAVPTGKPKRIAVIGAGPAGLACASEAATRGHKVSLFEKSGAIGGQFNLAKKIPGKEEYAETIRYFSQRLKETGVEILLNTEFNAAEAKKFDEVIIAAGVHPRIPAIEGIDHPKVIHYDGAINGARIGKRIAIIGAGGIGIDVATFLLDEREQSQSPHAFMKAWGVDTSFESRGGLAMPAPVQPRRQIYLLQRSAERIGRSLGITTGWIHLASLKRAGVQMMGGVTYEKIDDHGLHISKDGEKKVLDVDNVIICAGQEPNNGLYESLKGAVSAHIIGGAREARELDAKRAIAEGIKLAQRL